MNLILWSYMITFPSLNTFLAGVISQEMMGFVERTRMSEVRCSRTSSWDKVIPLVNTIVMTMTV